MVPGEGYYNCIIVGVGVDLLSTNFFPGGQRIFASDLEALTYGGHHKTNEQFSTNEKVSVGEKIRNKKKEGWLGWTE